MNIWKPHEGLVRRPKVGSSATKKSTFLLFADFVIYSAQCLSLALKNSTQSTVTMFITSVYFTFIHSFHEVIISFTPTGCWTLDAFTSLPQPHVCCKMFLFVLFSLISRVLQPQCADQWPTIGSIWLLRVPSLTFSFNFLFLWMWNHCWCCQYISKQVNKTAVT